MLVEGYPERILDSCYIEYYLSASYDGGRIEWPWRMFPPSESYERYRQTCDQFIMDSEFNDASVTNRDVLDKAVEIGADTVVLEDVYKDFDGTVTQVLKGLEIAESHEFDGGIICPLQKPWVDCWKELGEPENIAIGGLRDGQDSTRIRVAKKLRKEAGESAYIHGLGWGATDKIIRVVRENPDLLDSIDAKTEGVEAQKYDYWGGDEQSTPLATFTLARLLEKCRRMGPHPDPPGDTTLSQFA